MGDWFPPLAVVLTLVLIISVTAWLEVKKNKKENLETTRKENYHKELVRKINEAQSLWTAKLNRFAIDKNEATDWLSRETLPTHLLLHARRLMEANYANETRDHLKWLQKQNIRLPDAFDAREKWPNCWTVHRIFDQGGCGSCWAVAATSVMSDRVCIHSNGTQQPSISVEDLISCCHDCGGCRGSYGAMPAFEFWKQQGLVSGGAHGSAEGCRPYTISAQCGRPCSAMYFSHTYTPKCNKQCQNTFDKDYDSDKYYGGIYYALDLERLLGNKPLVNGAETAEAMAILTKKELMVNGPVMVCFPVNEDFQHYHSGIYTRVYKSDKYEGLGDKLYGHCTRLIGWGKEQGNGFWIIANSWGRNWGENGVYRLHESLLPTEIVAVLPDFYSYK